MIHRWSQLIQGTHWQEHGHFIKKLPTEQQRCLFPFWTLSKNTHVFGITSLHSRSSPLEVRVQKNVRLSLKWCLAWQHEECRCECRLEIGKFETIYNILKSNLIWAHLSLEGAFWFMWAASFCSKRFGKIGFKNWWMILMTLCILSF